MTDKPNYYPTKSPVVQTKSNFHQSLTYKSPLVRLRTKIEWNAFSSPAAMVCCASSETDCAARFLEFHFLGHADF